MLNFLIGTYPLRLETADKIFLFTAAGILAAGLILAMLLYFRSFSPVNRGLLKRFKNLSVVYSRWFILLNRKFTEKIIIIFGSLNEQEKKSGLWAWVILGRRRKRLKLGQER